MSNEIKTLTVNFWPGKTRSGSGVQLLVTVGREQHTANEWQHCFSVVGASDLTVGADTNPSKAANRWLGKDWVELSDKAGGSAELLKQYLQRALGEDFTVSVDRQ